MVPKQIHTLEGMIMATATLRNHSVIFHLDVTSVCTLNKYVVNFRLF